MINKVILVGRTGTDPEIKTIKSGEMAIMSIATTEKVTDKETQQKKDKTTWHKVVTFDPNLSKTIKDYVTKGTLLYLEGQIDVSQYTDSSGNKKYNTSILIPRFSGVMKMLGGKNDKSVESVNHDALPDDDIPDIPF
ncbi:MAG: putative single-stranded DNA-binding protein [Prokaryotic dsDNA virus sp.]|nr:MAG: putative single-stranded DNA-binding protein [Prokaryotic dsDNA virus sp.]|tara:strand:- start:3090 stop:3500 length:411 start_codon:yes stop_codon:yes gene_type:complete